MYSSKEVILVWNSSSDIVILGRMKVPLILWISMNCPPVRRKGSELFNVKLSSVEGTKSPIISKYSSSCVVIRFFIRMGSCLKSDPC